MSKKLSTPKNLSKKNVDNVPNQSGVYVINNSSGNKNYVGMAGAGRLKDRLKEHLVSGDIPGAVSFQILPTTSKAEAIKLEKKYIARLKPKYNKKK